MHCPSASVHDPELANKPDPSLVKLTDPAGVAAVLPLALVTTALQLVAVPTDTELGEQVTVVSVVTVVIVSLVWLLLPAWVLSPA